MEWTHALLLFTAAVVAGAVNAVAGGGTLLTFPALLWVGQAAVIANATSTVALVPGALSSFWGYRRELGSGRRAIVVLLVPSFLGGCVGALLLVHTRNETFEAVVPYLVLAATLIFAAQGLLARRLQGRAEAASQHNGPSNTEAFLFGEVQAGRRRWALVVGFQFLVAVYGGYFGAGIGILMLAAFGFLGLTHIHRMNALKNINGACINAVAAALFMAQGLVEWRWAILMAVGAVLGGYAGAGFARRLGQANVRRIVILIGLVLTVLLLRRA